VDSSVGLHIAVIEGRKTLLKVAYCGPSFSRVEYPTVADSSAKGWQSFFAHKRCFAAAIRPSHRIFSWEDALSYRTVPGEDDDSQ